jgi:threonine/homoserine/homoserine lactone efflux protein
LRENNKISTIMHKLCGMIFIGLGLKLAFEKK